MGVKPEIANTEKDKQRVAKQTELPYKKQTYRYHESEERREETGVYAAATKPPVHDFKYLKLHTASVEVLTEVCCYFMGSVVLNKEYIHTRHCCRDLFFVLVKKKNPFSL